MTVEQKKKASEMYANGYGAKRIAQYLCVSKNAVEDHITRIKLRKSKTNAETIALQSARIKELEARVKELEQLLLED